jgi:hypothetical protein
MCLKETCREEFVTKANVIHENKYDYSKTLYENAITKIIINCKLHGEFNISPNNHLNGKGCKICGIELSRISKVKSFDAYYREFIRIYGKKYDYSHVKWEGACNPISILCEKHGEFDVIPYLHKKGRECPKCSNRYSKISIDWLLFMEIVYSVEIVHATNIGEFLIPETRYKADGYLKSLNIIFEFHGDFWHGNPKVYDKSLINPRVGITYGELYQKTVMKSNIIKAKGYNLIEVWEYDWKKFTNGIICIQKKFKSRYK